MGTIDVPTLDALSPLASSRTRRPLPEGYRMNWPRLPGFWIAPELEGHPVRLSAGNPSWPSRRSARKPRKRPRAAYGQITARTRKGCHGPPKGPARGHPASSKAASSVGRERSPSVRLKPMTQRAVAPLPQNCHHVKLNAETVQATHGFAPLLVDTCSASPAWNQTGDRSLTSGEHRTRFRMPPSATVLHFLEPSALQAVVASRLACRA